MKAMFFFMRAFEMILFQTQSLISIKSSFKQFKNNSFKNILKRFAKLF
jgi:hypothetical protein